MVKLTPMTDAEFEQFISWAKDDYAQAQIKAGAWTEENAADLAEKMFTALLPNRSSSPNQHLLMIERLDNGEKVGQVWWGIQEREGKRFATLNDFHVFPENRRSGYGSKALKAMEEMVRAESIDQIFLHVFGSNEPARALYRKMGYLERNVTMVKQL